MADLNGKHVVITGASRGIGAAAAREFAQNGAHVTVMARTADALAELVAEIGEAAFAASCDVSDYASLSGAIDRARAKFGPVDVLINNAGVIEPISHIAKADPAGFAKAIEINLNGVFYGMRAVLPEMMAQGSGTILTVSSGAAHNAIEAWAHYCSSKAGAAMLTSCAHLEAAHKGVRVMGLSPGTVATQMQREIKSSGINPVSQLDWEVHVPADWPAKTLVWMCTDASDAWLGQEISLRDEDIRRKVGLI